MPGPHQGTGKFVSTVSYRASDSCIHNIVWFMKLELYAPAQPWNWDFLLASLDIGISGFGYAFPQPRIRNIHLPLQPEAPVWRRLRITPSIAFPHWKQADLQKKRFLQNKPVLLASQKGFCKHSSPTIRDNSNQSRSVLETRYFEQ